MIGIILSSSMSSSARAVFLGRFPGIFLLMKWITCSRTGGLPVVGGGALVCFLANLRSTRLPRRWALYDQSIITLRVALMVVGSVAFRKNMPAAVDGLKLFLSILRS